MDVGKHCHKCGQLDFLPFVPLVPPFGDELPLASTSAPAARAASSAVKPLLPLPVAATAGGCFSDESTCTAISMSCGSDAIEWAGVGISSERSMSF